MHFDKATLNTGSVSPKHSSAAVLVTRGAPPHRVATLATRVVHFMQIHVDYTCPRQDRAIVTPPTFFSQVSTTCTLSGARNFNLSGGFSGDWRKEDDHWLNHTIPGVLF